MAGGGRGGVLVLCAAALCCLGGGVFGCGARTGLQTDDETLPDEAVQLADACTLQQAQYEEFKRQTIEEQTFDACTSADDCILFRDRTGCGSPCPVVIPGYARRGIDDRLYAYAASHCAAGCPTVEPECPAAPSPKCVLGSCQ